MLDLNDQDGTVPPCGLPYQHSGAHEWQPANDPPFHPVLSEEGTATHEDLENAWETTAQCAVSNPAMPSVLCSWRPGHKGSHRWEPREQLEAGDSGLQPLTDNLLTDHDLRAYRARAYEAAGLSDENLGEPEMPHHATGCMLQSEARVFCTRCVMEQSALVKGGYAIEQRLGQEIGRLNDQISFEKEMRLEPNSGIRDDLRIARSRVVRLEVENKQLQSEVKLLIQKVADLTQTKASVHESLEADLSHERATLRDLRLRIAALEHIAIPRSNPLWSAVLGAFVDLEGDRTETWGVTRMKMAEALVEDGKRYLREQQGQPGALKVDGGTVTVNLCGERNPYNDESCSLSPGHGQWHYSWRGSSWSTGIGRPADQTPEPEPEQDKPSSSGILDQGALRLLEETQRERDDLKNALVLLKNQYGEYMARNRNDDVDDARKLQELTKERDVLRMQLEQAHDRVQAQAGLANEIQLTLDSVRSEMGLSYPMMTLHRYTVQLNDEARGLIEESLENLMDQAGLMVRLQRHDKD